eukprot:m.47205 g.47205  ORF g.47205 m.47205 type:complete len:745 (-) comp20446_c0_seq1:240-2474(-)
MSRMACRSASSALMALFIGTALDLASTSASSTSSSCPAYRLLNRGIANSPTAIGNFTANSVEECCGRCSNTSTCTAWSYHPPNTPMAKECWLMAVPAPEHGVPGSVISGITVSPTQPPTPIPLPKTNGALGFRPNIVFVLTDDQDATQHSMEAMPLTRNRYGLDTGTQCTGGGSCFNLTRAYVATPICCPSRSSYLTGKYIHNHHTIQNSGQMGCAGAEWVATQEPRGYAAYLATAGYSTGFFGKYLNAYGHTTSAPPSHVPNGWHEWVGLVGNSVYYDYTLSINGTTEQHGSDYGKDYLTDLLANRSVTWLREQLASITSNPIACVVHTPAPHRPAMPAPQYMDSFSNRTAPRTPSWNVVSKDKHRWLSDLSPMDPITTEYSDHLWRRRLRSLQSVDELVERHFAAVEAAGALNRTVFVYTSDHGYHSGQWGVAYCKMLPYEEDVRIPMFIRLPLSLGAQDARHDLGNAAMTIGSVVINIDLAPTLLDLAGYPDTPDMDGRSMIPMLLVHANTHSDLSEPSDVVTDFGRSFLIEYFPIQTHGNDVQSTVKGVDGWCTDPDCIKNPCPSLQVTVDSVNNTYACLRTITAAPTEDTIFCHFWDGSGYTEAFNRTNGTHNFAEFYDMTTDPWQLENKIFTLDPVRAATYVERLYHLIGCAGAHKSSENYSTDHVQGQAPARPKNASISISPPCVRVTGYRERTCLSSPIFLHTTISCSDEWKRRRTTFTRLSEKRELPSDSVTLFS